MQAQQSNKNFTLKNINAYNKKADNYDKTFDGKFTDKFKTLLLNELNINAGETVLDVGCGNGTLLSRIAKNNQIKGFGTDISPQMIKNAKSRYPQFTFAVSDCENLPFDENSIDVITVCAAYHHFADTNAFATEAKRLLKTGGKLYIAEIYLPSVLRNIANIFLHLSPDGDVKFYSQNEISETLAKVGFKFVKETVNTYIQIVIYSL